MKPIFKLLTLALALVPLAGYSQKIDLGTEISDRERFQSYPHLEKGFSAMARGDRNRALAEFEQAHRLVPNNPLIALHLANAYRRFGETTRAQSLLREQLKRNPGNAALAQALSDLSAASMKPTAQPSSPARGKDLVPAVVRATVPTAPSAVSTSPNTKNPVRKKTGASIQRLHLAPHAPPLSLRSSAKARKAYAAANLAYRASEHGEHEKALASAREAVRHAPANTDYRRLLIYSLTETGQYDEAQAEAEQLESRATKLHTDPAWTNLRALIQERRAFSHFDEANRAAERGDLNAALRQSELGVATAPSALPQRLQRIGLLLQAGENARAEQVAAEGLQYADHAALHLLRGVALQAQGKVIDAAGELDTALAMPGSAPFEQQNFRLIAVDMALAGRDARLAERLLSSMPALQDSGIAGRSAEVQEALHRGVTPASLYTPRMRIPIVRCYGANFTAGCEIWPGQDTPNAGSAAAQAAYQAYARHDYVIAADQALKATQASPGHVPYRLLRLQALVAQGRSEQALEEASEHLSLYGDAPEILALRSRLRYRMGLHELASADAQAALESGGLSLSSEIDLLIQEGRSDEASRRFANALNEDTELRNSADPDLGYLAMRVGDDTSAMSIFDRAQEQGHLPVMALQDAAYTASRLAENDKSIEYFKRAIDAADDGALALPAREHFATRREIADRERTWGINALVGYRGITPGTAATTPGLYGNTAQAVGEVYWRPQGFRDGRFWELYGGLAQTLHSQHGGATGSETLQGAFGLRTKPLREHNVVLSIERRVKIGSSSSSDWLLRAGYSGGIGTDLHIDVPDWTTINVYTEVGRFLHAERNYATFEGQAGRSFRMNEANSRLVVFPHAVIGADYDSHRAWSGEKSSSGAGPGIAMRYWYREDKYDAPRSYLDFSVQYRWRLSGDDRGKGWFVRAALVY